MRRSRVDLPEPERPRRPTISPGRKARFTCSSTTSWSPSGLRKDLQIPCTPSRGARLSAGAVAFTAVSSDSSALSADTELALGARVERPPEDAIQRHHEEAQDYRTEDHALEVRARGRVRNVGAEPVGG